MSYKLPKQQYKHEDFITLNEGFHRVGMFLLPQEWIGHEDSAWPTSNHETLSDEKHSLEAKLHRCTQQERTIRLIDSSDMDDTEYKDYTARLQNVEYQTRQSREKRDQFGRTYNARYIDSLAYNRRQLVEKYLCDAMRCDPIGRVELTLWPRYLDKNGKLL